MTSPRDPTPEDRAFEVATALVTEYRQTELAAAKVDLDPVYTDWLIGCAWRHIASALAAARAAGEASGRAEAFEAAANEAYAHRDLYNGSEKHLRFRVAIEIAATIREIAKPLSPPVAEPESKP